MFLIIIPLIKLLTLTLYNEEYLALRERMLEQSSYKKMENFLLEKMISSLSEPIVLKKQRKMIGELFAQGLSNK